MNAVTYARYSCDNQREESIEGQLRECKQYAEKNNVSIVGEYIDRAFSAKTDNRPEFQKMIKDSYAKEFDAVIVWKLDRFARNRYDSVRYKTILRKNGVDVISATENISKSAEGIILEAVLEGYAEYYSVDLSEKVIRGMTENALKCKFNGGNVPIGFLIDENKNYQLNPLTAPFIKDAFEMYASNVSMKKIVEYLTQKGVRTYRNNFINVQHLSETFRNRKYIGEYKFRDVIIPNGIPRIVSNELFDTVQKKLDSRMRNSNEDIKKQYLLSTKLRCSKCNSLMCGESGKGRTGKTYYYYKCSSVKRHLGCDMRSIQQHEIDSKVLQKVFEYIKSKDVIRTIVKSVLKLNKKENAAILLLKKQYSCVDKNINNILDAISNGIYTESVQNKLLELEHEKKVLEHQIEIEQERVSEHILTEKQVTYWINNMLSFISEEKYSILVDCFVDEVHYFDD